MSETKAYTGSDFLNALKEEKLTDPLSLEGMAKLPDEGDGSFLFSPGTTCENWIEIPVSIVERVELIRVISCQDHTHPLIRLYLTEPPADNVFASLFTQFAKQASRSPSTSRGTCYGYDAGCPSHAPCAEQFPGGVYCTDCCIARTEARIPRSTHGAPPYRTHSQPALRSGWYCEKHAHCGDGSFQTGSATGPSRDIAQAEAEMNARYGCHGRGGVLSVGGGYCEPQ